VKERILLRLWTWLATHPRCYALARSGMATFLRMLARGQSQRGFLRSVLLVRGGWFAEHDLPAPAQRSFQSAWHARRRGGQA
jgi:hypothetical protein